MRPFYKYAQGPGRMLFGSLIDHPLYDEFVGKLGDKIVNMIDKAYASKYLEAAMKQEKNAPAIEKFLNEAKERIIKSNKGNIFTEEGMINPENIKHPINVFLDEYGRMLKHPEEEVRRFGSNLTKFVAEMSPDVRSFFKDLKQFAFDMQKKGLMTEKDIEGIMELERAFNRLSDTKKKVIKNIATAKIPIKDKAEILYNYVGPENIRNATISGGAAAIGLAGGIGIPVYLASRKPERS